MNNSNIIHKINLSLLVLTGLYSEVWADESFIEEESSFIKNHTNTSPYQPKEVFAFAFDGGGVRGLKQATILARIEEETGKKITDIAHLMIGTSTGSIITALALSDENGKQKFSARDAVNLYKEHSATIFARPLSQVLSNPFGIRGALYQSSNLSSVLKRYIGDSSFTGTLLPTFITAYDVTQRKEVLFSSMDISAAGWTMRHLIRASCAAPGYFKSKTLKHPNGERQELMDGCMYAINPAELAYKQAKKLYPNDIIHVVSIGTGQRSQQTTHADTKTRGLTTWASWVPIELFYNQSDRVHKKLDRKLNSDPDNPRYFRLQTTLGGKYGDFDDASPANLKYLEKTANEMMKTDPMFQQLLKKLKR